MPSCRNCTSSKPFSRTLTSVESAAAQPETWVEPAPGVENDVPRLRPNATADTVELPDVEIFWKLRIGMSYSTKDVLESPIGTSIGEAGTERKPWSKNCNTPFIRS